MPHTPSEETIRAIDRILDYHGAPADLPAFIAGLLRELSGSRHACLAGPDPQGRGGWTIRASAPPSPPAPSAEWLAIFGEAAVRLDGPRRFRPSDGSAPGRLLAAGTWQSADLVPLNGGTAVTGFVLLANPAPSADDHPAPALKPVARVAGLVLDNVSTWTDLEDAIERRTSELAASELRFRSLTDSTPVGVYQVAIDGTCVYVNAAWSAITGMPAAEAYGKDWTRVIHHEDRPAVLERLQASAAAQATYYQEFRMQRDDGAIVWVLCQASPLYGIHGALDGYVGTTVDITERIIHEQALRNLNDQLERRVAERTEQLSQTNHELQTALERTQRLQEAIIVKEKLASLTPMVAGVSHELNTPIGNIAVLASALQDRINELMARPREAVSPAELWQMFAYLQKSNEMVLKSASFAANLVQSFKKVVIDREGAQRRCFRLRELAEDCINLVRPNYKKHPWQLVNEVPGELELDSYPGALGQVLDNLLRNALIHAFEGRCDGAVRIGASIKSDRESPGGASGWIVLTVSDDGRGISPANRQRIFDPFFTTHLGSGGSGLGLSIAYNLVQQLLGGAISVESRTAAEGYPPEACGTTFIIEIPQHLGGCT